MAMKKSGALGAKVAGTLQASIVSGPKMAVPKGKVPATSSFGVGHPTSKMKAVHKPGKSSFSATAGTKVRPGGGSKAKTGKGAM